MTLPPRAAFVKTGDVVTVKDADPLPDGLADTDGSVSPDAEVAPSDVVPDVADSSDAPDTLDVADGDDTTDTEDVPSPLDSDTYTCGDNCDTSSPDNGQDICQCGDKICSAACGESLTSCSADCAQCGDDVCSPGEDPKNCAKDCCGSCGDGECRCTESASNCASDCLTGCGDGACSGEETKISCPGDCKAQGQICGDGVCEPGDGGAVACPQDCDKACGNCSCQPGEDYLNCPVDCGYCGDGICSLCSGTGETLQTCPADCKNPEDGTCKGVVCNDGNSCTSDSCVTGQGCVYVPAAGVCDDANACTIGDACSDGECLPGAETECSDGNVCTSADCDTAAGCTYAANDEATPCSDGDVCTVGDLCAETACLPGAQTVCEDGNACTSDSCDKLSGCEFAQTTAACDDANACTEGDVCGGGVCAGSAKVCNDSNPCTDDACNPESGCVFTANSAACDDANACTKNDVCAVGTCAGVAYSCSASDACHDVGTCKGDGTCSNPAKAGGAACSDGSLCTVNDACSAGVCLPGAQTVCDDANGCTSDTCVSLAGCVFIATTTGCDDNNACTEGDVCGGSSCGGSAKVCNDSNPCTDDSCNPASGCVFTANTAACNDNNACTKNDVCAASVCAGVAYTCSALDACHDVGTCKGDGTCTNPAKADGAACVDANLCTTGDKCLGGGCTGGSGALNCDDSKPCTTDGCVAATGCTHVSGNDGATCSDGDACTVGDVCAAGVCKGTAPICGNGSCDCGETAASCAADCSSEPPMVIVPGGTFLMGSADGTGNADEHPQHQVTLSTFAIDKSEVTVAQYKAFYDQLSVGQKCTSSNTSSFACGQPGTSSGCNWSVAGKDQYPANCTDWFQATAYCAWAHAGGRLMTEAEFEYAVRSGGKDQDFPWGNAAATCALNVMDDGGPGCGTGGTMAVCSKTPGNSSQGACDLVGNVVEWTSDRYGAYSAGAQINPTGALTGTNRVIRVGSFLTDTNPVYYPKAPVRNSWSPSMRYWDGGFRCAKSLDLCAGVTCPDGPCGAKTCEPTTGQCVTKAGGGACAEPKELSGLAVWLDASDASTVLSSTAPNTPATSGQGIVKWLDKSGKGSDVAQLASQGVPVLTANVLKGKPVARFTRTSKLSGQTLTGTQTLGSSALTVILVHAYRSKPNGTGDYQWGTALSLGHEPDTVLVVSSDKDKGFTHYGSAMFEEATPMALNQFRIQSLTYDLSQVEAFLNGVSMGTAKALPGASLGPELNLASYYYNAGLTGWEYFPDSDIAEVIVYNRALSDSERAAVEGYLKVKYFDLCAGVSCPELACATQTCDATTGTCVATPKANGTTCDDGNACTTGDTCQASVCQGGAAANCDDANACTADSCSAGPGCAHANVADWTTCGAGLVCSSGVCSDVKVAKSMAFIPAGTFWMGCNAAKDTTCNADEKPQHRVTQDAYYMDLTETTVAQYKACVDAGVCTAPASQQPAAYATYPGLTNNPVNFLTWSQSQAYCKWRGGEFDLPTEAQWEMAARGSCEHNGSTAADPGCAAAMRTYPWGEAAPTCTYTVRSEGGNGCGTGATWAVGSKPLGDSPYGLHDMAGNAWEWTRDWQGAYSAGDQSAPEGPPDGSLRIMRGGCFDNYNIGFLRTARRGSFAPSAAYGFLGLRCSRTLAAVTSCSGLPDGTPCTDSNACTTGETCQASNCSGGAVLSCDDANSCTTDNCDAATGCKHVNASAGTACNTSGTCDGTGNCDLSAPSGMVLIPAGTFWMGCNASKDAACNPDEKPQHKVTLTSYFIDATETTVAQYKACVDAGVCTVPSQVQSSSPAATYPGLTQNPVNHVNWTQAQAFCKWRGSGFDLPTEAQWEMAARGSCEKNGSTATDPACAAAMRTFPWGEATPTCSYAVMREGPGVANYGCDTGKSWAVGAKPASDSPYGVHDMAGNVEEWNRDWYASAYPSAAQTNPTGPASGTDKTHRGGSYQNPAVSARSAKHSQDPPSFSHEGVGFRCVKDDLCAGVVCPSLPCASNTCDTGTGQCVATPKADGVACTDSNACTTGETCKASVCQGGTATNCDDANACTTDSCSAGPGCAHANVADGADCSQDGCMVATCTAGTCGGSTFAPAGSTCPAAFGNPGKSGFCNGFGQCVECMWASDCYVNPAWNPQCYDMLCTTGMCDFYNYNNGEVCNDSAACTADDRCSQTYQCAGTALADGTTCDDAQPCTTGETCQASVCQGGAAANCDDANACTIDACDAAKGCTHTNVSAGTDCGGAKVCDAAGACVVGLSGMVLIPGGTFWMGCNSAKEANCNADESPQHKVTLSSYYMDVNETTMTQWKSCVDAGGCTPPQGDGNSTSCNWDTAGGKAKSGREQFPVNCVTWTQSQAYCKWRGSAYDLPTEAQWEMAARGDCVKNGKTAGDATCAQAMRKYPWADSDADCTYAVMSNGTYGCGTKATWAVGSKTAGDSPYGLHDMAGNVWEWNRDWYATYVAGDQTNPTGPGSATYRVIRGGSFYNDASDLRAGHRDFGVPSNAESIFGLRCSRTYP